MKFCRHDWKRIEKPKHQKWNYSGQEVLIAMCVCSKCGKKEERQFAGKYAGQLFG